MSIEPVIPMPEALIDQIHTKGIKVEATGFRHDAFLSQTLLRSIPSFKIGFRACPPSTLWVVG